MKPRSIPPQRLLAVSVICFVLGVLILSLMLCGCASTKGGRVLNVGVVGADAGDYTSTKYGEARGAHEVNVIIGNGAIRQAVVKASGALLVIYLASVIEKSHPNLAQVVRGAAIVGWTLAAVHNVRMQR